MLLDYICNYRLLPAVLLAFFLMFSVAGAAIFWPPKIIASGW
jgi:hypothetical protein